MYCLYTTVLTSPSRDGPQHVTCQLTDSMPFSTRNLHTAPGAFVSLLTTQSCRWCLGAGGLHRHDLLKSVSHARFRFLLGQRWHKSGSQIKGHTSITPQGASLLRGICHNSDKPHLIELIVHMCCAHLINSLEKQSAQQLGSESLNRLDVLLT
jgi:hypothetical protein